MDKVEFLTIRDWGNARTMNMKLRTLVRNLNKPQRKYRQSLLQYDLKQLEHDAHTSNYYKSKLVTTPFNKRRNRK